LNGFDGKVVIIGAGIAGLAAAWHLKKIGMWTTLIDYIKMQQTILSNQGEIHEQVVNSKSYFNGLLDGDHIFYSSKSLSSLAIIHISAKKLCSR
jgi:pyruvate/2-oxoglutarate dehydrogenase complex dihydrolipoamide dehydrogenase (E3) component